MRPFAAVCFRKSTSPPAETLSVYVQPAASSGKEPSSSSSSAKRRPHVSIVVEGDELGEVDWAAEAPSPERLYRAVAHDRVEDVLAGGRASFIACGQAGSGKSSTVFFHEVPDGARAGMLPRAAMHRMLREPRARARARGERAPPRSPGACENIIKIPPHAPHKRDAQALRRAAVRARRLGLRAPPRRPARPRPAVPSRACAHL